MEQTNKTQKPERFYNKSKDVLERVKESLGFAHYVNQFSEQGIEIDLYTESSHVSEPCPVSKPNQTKIDQFIRERRKEKDHLTLERFRESELKKLEGFSNSIWNEFEAIIGAMEKTLKGLQESETLSNPMTPVSLPEASQKGLYNFLNEKGVMETDFENFRAVISGQPFYYPINWKGKKTHLKRVLLWIHNNAKQDKNGRWIPFNDFAATCFKGIDSKGFPDGIKPFYGPELKELQKRIEGSE